MTALDELGTLRQPRRRSGHQTCDAVQLHSNVQQLALQLYTESTDYVKLQFVKGFTVRIEYAALSRIIQVSYQHNHEMTDIFLMPQIWRQLLRLIIQTCYQSYPLCPKAHSQGRNLHAFETLKVQGASRAVHDATVIQF